MTSTVAVMGQSGCSREYDRENNVKSVQRFEIGVADEQHWAVVPVAGQEGGDDDVSQRAEKKEILISLRATQPRLEWHT